MYYNSTPSSPTLEFILQLREVKIIIMGVTLNLFSISNRYYSQYDSKKQLFASHFKIACDTSVINVVAKGLTTVVWSTSHRSGVGPPLFWNSSL